ncbi:hypothetical protein GSU3507 [Geobacter sulfurreducens PCA]|uniref:Uncharacterized protein n=1 Tax=Geobacter sulfurreducens (strain ATCC 51573 / DSM 12127 / PCA) TaxID=243231 RepID=I7EP33_GEOSL|nr:hypothetical protein KN400_3423 [Geobacter sulfurreducens KN400]AFP20410.1 hypothetical protein GSU3507 [Geobacter sulfurreducens PCA]HBB69725.1 hypothetical protein [Geobacter sulfurreducens]HCD96880.1 hypothetical protein [Geobacter sulfurreducens]
MWRKIKSTNKSSCLRCVAWLVEAMMHTCKKVIAIMTQGLLFLRQKYTVQIDKTMQCEEKVYIIH